MRIEMTQRNGVIAFTVTILVLVTIYWWRNRPHVVEEILLSDHVRNVEMLIAGRPIGPHEQWGKQQPLEVRFLKGPKFPKDSNLFATIFFVPDGILGNRRTGFVASPLIEAFPNNRRPKGSLFPKPSVLPSEYSGVQLVGFWGSDGLDGRLQIRTGDYAVILSIEATDGASGAKRSYPVHQTRVHMERFTR